MASNANLAQNAETPPETSPIVGEQGTDEARVADTPGPADDANVVKSNGSSLGSNSSFTDKGRIPLHELLLHVEENSSNASENEDLAKMLKGLTKTEINSPDGAGTRPLHIAARRGLVTAVRMLLENGADIEAATRDGSRPLHEACWGGAAEVVNLLLGSEPNSANPNIIAEDGWFPLIIAVQQQHREIVERLLREPDLDLNAVDKDDGVTALNHAAYRGYEAIFDALLERRADINLQDHDHWTPLFTATRQQNFAIMVKLLKPESDGKIRSLETSGPQGFTPLLSACENGFTRGVERLLSAGANCNAQSDSGSTPLIEASRGNHMESVQALLGDGKEVKIDLGDQRKWTALHTASSEGHHEVVQLLVRAGANCNAQSDSGSSPLIEASRRGHTKVIEALCQTNGLTMINLTDKKKQTALHVASYEGHREVAEFLLKKGADVDLEDSSDRRALHLASTQGNNNVVVLLLDRGAKMDWKEGSGRTLLTQAFEADGISGTTKSIVKHIAQTRSDKEKDDALIWAAEESARHEVAQLLLSNIPTPLQDDELHESRGWSAIEWAAYRIRPQILVLLLRSSPPDSTTRQLVESAERLLEGGQKERSKLGEKDKKNQYKAAMRRKSSKENINNPRAADSKHGDPSTDRDLVKDILQDPSIFQIDTDSRDTEWPNPSRLGRKVSGDCQAAIIQMYKKEGRFAAIRRSRTVGEVVYDRGPRELMKEANEKLKDIVDKTFEKKYAVITKQVTYINSGLGFIWIHLPLTNIAWMEDLLWPIIMKDKRNSADYPHVRAFFRDSWVEVPDRRSPFRSMRPRFVERTKRKSQKWQQRIILDHEGEEKENGKGENKGKGGEMNSDRKGGADIDNSRMDEEETEPGVLAASAIYMPYLSFSTYCREDQDPMIKDQRRKNKHEQLEPQIYSDGEGVLRECKEAQKRYRELVDGYPGSAVHDFPTLDEWYYQFATDDEQSEKDKQHRNKSQVITKSLDQAVDKSKHWRLLRVNQLWAWTIGNECLITATNDPNDGSKDKLWEGVLTDLDKLTKMGSTSLQPGTPRELSRLIVDHCIGFYERRPKVTKAPKDKPLNKGDGGKREEFSVRQTFSDTINKLGRDQTDLIKMFASQSVTADDTNKKVSLTGSEMLEASRKAGALSCDIKDIRDELNILKSIANHQITVQKKLAVGSGNKRQETLLAENVLRDIEELDKVAGRIDLVVDTARSLQQGQESVRQGRIFMIFTVVTILFLPLSFLSSLFALDVASFRQAPGWAFAVIFAVSLTVSLPLAAIAYLEEVKNLLSRIRGNTNATEKDKPDKNNISAVTGRVSSHPEKVNAETKLASPKVHLEYDRRTIENRADQGNFELSGNVKRPSGLFRRKTHRSSSQMLQDDLELAMMR